MLRKLVEIQYDRAEDLRRGTFRVRGDMIEIYPPYDDFAVRVEMWGSQIEAIRKIDPLTGEIRSRDSEIDRLAIYPENALRAARRAKRARHPDHLRRARLVEGRTRAQGKDRRGAARGAAHPVRYRNDAHHRLSATASKIIRAIFPAACPAKRRPRCSITCRRFPALHRRVAPDRSAASRHVCTATARARKRWWTTASACPRPSTTAR